MAYPTIDGPYGLDTVKLLSGTPFVGPFRHFKIANAYNTAIYFGDVVKLVSAGTVERDAFSGTMDPIGVFAGCSYTDPVLGYKLRSQYYPGGVTEDDIEAYVVDSPDLLFKAAVLSTGTTIGTLSQADIGANVAGIDNAGVPQSGKSRGGISSTTANTATLPFRVVGLVEETKTAADAYVEAYVKWNAGIHRYNNPQGV